MAQTIPYRSDTKAFIAGSTLDFFDFVPARGPRGGRNVIDRFIINVTGTLTVAGALLDGRDVPRLFNLMGVETRSNRSRWSLSGYKSALAAKHLMGVKRWVEHANVAVGASQAVDAQIVLPMYRPFTKRPKDFSLPSDVFKRVSLVCHNLGALTSGVTLSAPALSVYVTAICHEEFSVEFKIEDSVTSVDFTNNTEAKFNLNGPVHDLLVVRELSSGGTAGGDVITAVTDARIDELGLPVTRRQDFAADYTVRREVGNTAFSATPGAEQWNDPVREGKVLPVIMSDEETSFADGRIVENMKLNVSGGVANCSVVIRQLLARDPQTFDATVARFGLSATALRIKTAAKSKQAPRDWDADELAYAPLSAPLPMGGR